MSVLLAILLALFPACPTEDSTGCVWDAQTHGNGEGRTFLAIGETTIFLGDAR